MSLQQQQDVPAFAFGNSLYGGRPTFGLTRRGDGSEAMLTLYELLPREQAEARRQRLERAGRSAATAPFEEVFETPSSNDARDWSWDDWVAIKVGQLTESRLQAVQSLVKEILKDADIDHHRVTGTGDDEILLPEAVGIRLTIAFVGIKPLQRFDRMRAVARGVARMSSEECYYWHAKCRSPSSPNGEKALRTLLTHHID